MLFGNTGFNLFNYSPPNGLANFLITDTAAVNVPVPMPFHAGANKPFSEILSRHN